MVHCAPIYLTCDLIIYFFERNISMNDEKKSRELFDIYLVLRQVMVHQSNWNVNWLCRSQREDTTAFQGNTSIHNQEDLQSVWHTFRLKVGHHRTNPTEMQTHSYASWGRNCNKIWTLYMHLHRKTSPETLLWKSVRPIFCYKVGHRAPIQLKKKLLYFLWRNCDKFSKTLHASDMVRSPKHDPG